MKDCLFCKIAGKEIKASVIFEDDKVMAFADIAPVAPIHAVVISKRHVEELAELSAEDLKAIYAVIEKISESKRIKDSGYRIIMNRGRDAGQAIAHLHFHVMGGRKMAWPPG